MVKTSTGYLYVVKICLRLLNARDLIVGPHVGIDVNNIQRELSTSAEASLVVRCDRQCSRGDGVRDATCYQFAVRVAAQNRKYRSSCADEGCKIFLKFSFGREPNKLFIELSRSGTTSASEK